MTGPDAAWRMPWLRYALLALVFSALWLGVGLFSSSSSATADDTQPNGLLSGVGSVVDGVTESIVPVGDTLGDAVGAVVETVDAVAEPVLEPVGAITAPVVHIVPEPVADLVERVVPGGVGSISSPVVDTVDEIAGSLPIVGGLLGDDTVESIVTPVTDVVDDSLGTLVGSIGDPTDRGPQTPAPPDPGATVGPTPSVLAVPGAGLRAGQAIATATGPLRDPAVLAGSSGGTAPGEPAAPPGDRQPALAPPGGPAGSGSGASASGAGGVSAGSDATFAALELDALASLVLRAVDDALPSSPVHDTDTTPD